MSRDNGEVILFDLIKDGLWKQNNFAIRIFIIFLSFDKDFFGIFFRKFSKEPGTFVLILQIYVFPRFWCLHIFNWLHFFNGIHSFPTRIYLVVNYILLWWCNVTKVFKSTIFDNRIMNVLISGSKQIFNHEDEVNHRGSKKLFVDS